MAQSIRSHPPRRRKRQTLDFTGASVLRYPNAAPKRPPPILRLSSLLGLVVIAILLVDLTAA